MGKRGPQPKSAAALRSAGSWREKARLAAEAPAAPKRREVPSPPRRPLPSTEAGWSELCRALPGYDPASGSGLIQPAALIAELVRFASAVPGPVPNPGPKVHRVTVPKDVDVIEITRV
jgi:hypothetical protein